jgi:Integrase core domain
MSTRPSRSSLPSSQTTASAKARWISNPMIRMPAPPLCFVQNGSWRATRHLLIRAHGASGKVARGGPVTSSGSQPTVYRRPARTFVLPAPRVPDGLTISPVPFRKQPDNQGAENHIPDNGQVERMNRTIKDATVKRYFYETHEQLRMHLGDFVDAYNFARRLKTLRGHTPYEFICKARTSDPQTFKISPLQQTAGPNN